MTVCDYFEGNNECSTISLERDCLWAQFQAEGQHLSDLRPGPETSGIEDAGPDFNYEVLDE